MWSVGVCEIGLGLGLMTGTILSISIFHIIFMFIQIHSCSFVGVILKHHSESITNLFRNKATDRAGGVKEAHKNVTMPAKSKTTKQYENENSSKTKSK